MQCTKSSNICTIFMVSNRKLGIEITQYPSYSDMNSQSRKSLKSGQYLLQHMPVPYRPIFYMLYCLAGFFHYNDVVRQKRRCTRNRQRTQLGNTSIQGLTPFFTARFSIARASFLLPLKGANCMSKSTTIDTAVWWKRTACSHREAHRSPRGL
jgi:hypothetical protein